MDLEDVETCHRCYALVSNVHYDAHQEWHARNDAPNP